MLKTRLVLALAFSAATLSAAGAQDSNSDDSLNGASSLSETHGDWVVSCAVVKGAKQCLMSQQQFSKDNKKQRLLAIEFLPHLNGNLKGTLAMPFGLALANPVVLSVDDKKIGNPAPYRTCYTIGCVVPLIFADGAAALLKNGAALNLEAVTAETQQPVRFKISLKGFASAYGRLQKLAAQ